MNLDALQTLFEKKGWKCSLEEQTEVSPTQLVIPIIDEIYLRLTLHTDEQISFLQYFVLFPVKVKAVEELKRLILSVNSGLDLGGFGYMEQDTLFYFRLTQIYDTFSETILDIYFDSICYLIDSYVPTMIEVAKGEKTLEALQQEAARSLEMGSL